MQPWDSNRRPRTFPTPNQETQAHTEGEAEQRNPLQRFAMIEGWNSKHLWIPVCMQAAREAYFAVSLTAGTELADGSESPELAD